MKKGVFGCFLLFVIVVFFAGIVSASFEVGNSSHSIEKQYSKGGLIRGWVNFSLDNEPVESIISDSFGNTIKLIDFLKLTAGSDYTCSPSDCENNYNFNGVGEAAKGFTLNSGEEKILGFKIIGSSFESFSSFSMNVLSNAGELSSPGLQIDLLNDGEMEWAPHTSSGNYGDALHGCYDGSGAQPAQISQQKYCEFVEIPPTPNVKIGANLIKDSEGLYNFSFRICNENEGTCASCDASANKTGEVSCIADYSIVNKGNFTVCVNAKSSADSGKYKINSENSGSKTACGYAGSNIETNKADFDMIARPSGFSPIGNFLLNETEIRNSNNNYFDMAFYLEQYVGKYNNVCSGEGCVVPIRFISNTDNQEINLSGISLSYTANGILKESNEIYEIQKTPANINSDFQKLNLDLANFYTPETTKDDISYSVKLDGKKLLSEDISVKDAPSIVSLNPTIAIAGYPTKFTIKTKSANGGSNISQYTWDFGDNTTTATTKINTTTHSYSEIGNFTVEVSIKDFNGFENSKSFGVISASPKDSVNTLLKQKSDNLGKVQLSLSSLPDFQKNSLTNFFDLENLQTNLSSLKLKNQSATSDDDFISIMNDLVGIKVPDFVSITKTLNNLRFYPSSDGLSIGGISVATGENYDSGKEESYKNAIIAWNLENVDSKIDEKEFSASFNGVSELALSFFTVKIDAGSNIDGSYLFIPKYDGMKFKQNYDEKETPGYYYFPLGSEGKTIEFYASQEILPEQSGIFVSPELSQLNLSGLNLVADRKKISKTAIIGLVIILSLMLGFILYIILQEWYKRKYEGYLFKNKNDLYNLASYLHGEKNKGLKVGEIEKKLKKAGWSSEQVRYAMRKYAGKSTGMAEIPGSGIMRLFLGSKKTNNKKAN